VKSPPYLLSICGKHELDRFEHREITHLLSIEDPGTPKETPCWFRGLHLQLQLHDIDTPAQAAAQEGVLPSLADVEAILQLGSECLAAAGTGPVHLLVHCYAGISRSTAAAFALTVQAVGVEHADDALAHVLEMRPQANPNLRIVRHADRLLRGRGRMVAALQPRREQLARELDAWLGRLPEEPS
jgi:predicted protein tyrosine phosphatase